MSEANGEDVVLDDWTKSKTKVILESMIIKGEIPDDDWHPAREQNYISLNLHGPHHRLISYKKIAYTSLMLTSSCRVFFFAIACWMVVLLVAIHACKIA